ncbi:MAG: hypothetical protein WEF53_01690 [Bacteroidota bacterium]
MTPPFPNLQKRIRSHSVAILNAETREIGSGVLIGLEGRVFVLSAAHVLEGSIDVNLGIIPHVTPFTILKRWTDSVLDIGYLELKPSEVELRLSEISAIYGVAIRRLQANIPTSKASIALCGFPSANSSETERGIEVLLTFIKVALLNPKNWPSVYKEKLDSNRHFVIRYGEKRGSRFMDGDGKIIQPMKPYGLSGSGVWFFNPDSEQTDNPAYALLGIQHTYDSTYEILYGTFLDDLIQRICDDYGISIPDSA